MANYKKSFNFRSGVQVDTDNFIVNANGLVGIGTSIPRRVLDVYGTIRTSGLVTSQQLYVTGISTFDSDLDLNNGTLFVGNNIKLGANSGVITATALNIGSRTVTELVGYSTEAWIIDPVINGISTTFNVGIGTTVSSNFDLLIGSDPQASQEGIGFDGSTGNIISSGIITATQFIGIVTASSLTETISNDRFPSPIIKNLQGDVTGIADTARGLTGTPDLQVGVTTASRVVSTSSSVGFATITDTLNVRGKVGIGTTLPTADLEILNSSSSAKLDIISSSGASSRISIGNSANVSTGTSVALFEYNNHELRIKNKDTGNIEMYLHTGDLQPGITTGSYEWRYRTESDPLAILTYQGNFGLGVASPSEKFHVSGASKFAGNVTFDSGYTFTINSNTLSVSESTTTTFSGAVNLNEQISIGATVGFDTSDSPELKVPRYTTSTRNGINASGGSIIYNESTQKLQFYDHVSGTWRVVTST